MVGGDGSNSRETYLTTNLILLGRRDSSDSQVHGVSAKYE